jgi:hypothetical protein
LRIDPGKGPNHQEDHFARDKGLGNRGDSGVLRGEDRVYPDDQVCIALRVSCVSGPVKSGDVNDSRAEMLRGAACPCLAG